MINSRKWWLSWKAESGPEGLPNVHIVGYWQSGWDSNDVPVYVGIVAANDEEEAWAAVEADWSDYDVRFSRTMFNTELASFAASDARFPLSLWMKERLAGLDDQKASMSK